MFARLWFWRLALLGTFDTRPLGYACHCFLKELFQIIPTIKWQLWNSTDWKSGECTDTHVSSQSFVKGFTVKQHRLEKQRTYRHSDVSSQSFKKDLMWNNTGWISRERTDTQCVIAIF